MNRFYIEIVCQSGGATAEHLEARFTDIADALYDLTEVVDADLGANFEDRTLEFMMFVDSDDEVGALTTALAATRTALHAAGHPTPGWEKDFETIQQTVRKEHPQYA